ncbi:uncharacterized protein LOC111370241 [Olea europaea var. sylvestris]|uniref:uncharacterized protein LOC111370241 n=1 Tax=Olea europaea var. sylvestris TaxID=158386 RepID=UPI000C1D5FD0|nr:uncharacterized protein LOC111370241 [Olea europaea var. sylvestris]
MAVSILSLKFLRASSIIFDSSSSFPKGICGSIYLGAKHYKWVSDKSRLEPEYDKEARSNDNPSYFPNRNQMFGNEAEDEGYRTGDDLIKQVRNAGPYLENWNENHNASHVTDISSGEIIDMEKVTMACRCPKCKHAFRVHANLTGKN